MIYVPLLVLFNVFVVPIPELCLLSNQKQLNFSK
jgi:hypothetical protein